MPRTATRPRKRLYHAIMQVTRVEEWCVEAGSPEEAKKLLESGEGHRCQLGDRVNCELQEIIT